MSNLQNCKITKIAKLQNYKMVKLRTFKLKAVRNSNYKALAQKMPKQAPSTFCKILNDRMETMMVKEDQIREGSTGY